MLSISLVDLQQAAQLAYQINELQAACQRITAPQSVSLSLTGTTQQIGYQVPVADQMAEITRRVNAARQALNALGIDLKPTTP